MLKKLLEVLKETIDDLIYMNNHVAYARKIGVSVGDNCKLLCNIRFCFGNEPFLITIGNHVEICDSVRFMPHDGAAWTYRHIDPKAAIYGPIQIGDNVFIGINTIILPGVKVGNNVIIGAGAVVTRDIPDNVVAAGVPARVIRPIENYYEKVAIISHPILDCPMKLKEEYLREHHRDWFE